MPDNDTPTTRATTFDVGERMVLDGTAGARFSHGPGRLLLEGGFRRRLDDGEFAAASALARARFLELMEGRR